MDAGDAFFKSHVLPNNTREADILKAETILNGYKTIGYACINVGGFDFANGTDFLNNLRESTDIPFISANIVNKVTGETVFDPHVILQSGNVKIGFVGLADFIPAHIEDLEVRDLLEVGQNKITELRDRVEVLIVLANADRKLRKEIQEKFSVADYVFISKDRSRSRPEMEQTGETLIYSCGIQGKYLAEVNLSFTKSGEKILDLTAQNAKLKIVNRRLGNLQRRDPQKPLREIYAGQPNILTMVDQYEAEKKTIEAQLTLAANKSEFKLIPLDKKVTSEPELLATVDKVLAECTVLTKNALQDLTKKIAKPGPDITTY